MPLSNAELRAGRRFWKVFSDHLGVRGFLGVKEETFDMPWLQILWVDVPKHVGASWTACKASSNVSVPADTRHEGSVIKKNLRKLAMSR